MTKVYVTWLILMSREFKYFSKNRFKVAISETLEFVNRDVLYKEEDQIKEILTEVSSQFNFMAPAAGESDCDESDNDVEPPINKTKSPTLA